MPLECDDIHPMAVVYGLLPGLSEASASKFLAPLLLLENLGRLSQQGSTVTQLVDHPEMTLSAQLKA